MVGEEGLAYASSALGPRRAGPARLRRRLRLGCAFESFLKFSIL